MYSRLFIGLLVLLAVALPRAHAQSEDVSATPDSSEPPWMRRIPGATQQAARELFLAGNALMDEQLYIKAAERFQEALRLWPHPAFHYNLAIAQINLDQPIAAYGNFRKARAYGPTPLGADKYEEAGNYLILIRNQLADLTITCAVPDAQVRLDGELLFVGPGQHQGLVRPGGHQLVVEKPDGVPYTRQLTLAPGERARHTVSPEVLVPVRRWAVWKPWAVTATGAVLTVGAGFLSWQSSRGFDAFDEGFDYYCAQGCVGMPVQLDNDLARARWQQRVSLVGFALGGAALFTGAVLIYLNRERLIRQDDETTPSLAILPTVTHDGTSGVALGAHVLGHF